MAFRSDHDALLARVRALEAQLEDARSAAELDRTKLETELEKTRSELAKARAPVPAPTPETRGEQRSRENAELRSEKKASRFGLIAGGVVAVGMVAAFAWMGRTAVEGNIRITGRGPEVLAAFSDCRHVEDARDPFRAIELDTVESVRVRLLNASPVPLALAIGNPPERWSLTSSHCSRYELDVTTETDTTDVFRGEAHFDCVLPDGGHVVLDAEFRNCE